MVSTQEKPLGHSKYGEITSQTYDSNKSCWILSKLNLKIYDHQITSQTYDSNKSHWILSKLNLKKYDPLVSLRKLNLKIYDHQITSQTYDSNKSYWILSKLNLKIYDHIKPKKIWLATFSVSDYYSNTIMFPLQRWSTYKGLLQE